MDMNAARCSRGANPASKVCILGIPMPIAAPKIMVGRINPHRDGINGMIIIAEKNKRQANNRIFFCDICRDRRPICEEAIAVVIDTEDRMSPVTREDAPNVCPSKIGK